MQISKNLGRLLIFCTCFFTCQSVLGQSSTVLKVKTGSYQLPTNINEIEVGSLKSSLFQNSLNVLIQFSKIPTNSVKAQLSERGVELHDYLPEKFFIATINQNTNLTELSSLGVTGIHEIKSSYKMSKDLFAKNYPSHALTGSNIKLNVRLIKEGALDPELLFARFGGVVIGSYPFSGEYRVTVPVNEIAALANFPLVKYLEVIPQAPVAEDIDGETNHRMNYISNPTINAVPFNGTDVWLAVGDDGAMGPHIDYSGRMDLSSVGSSTGTHGDHVAGIMMGAGNIDPDARGMAWGADIKVYNVWDAVNSTPVSYYNPGVVVTSTSYGDGCNDGYTSFAQTADQQVRQMPNLMHVFSAGNSGSSNCGYGAGSGWGNITGGIKSGKNVLAIGNVTMNNQLASSSSRGPATDGRIKPDICSNGTQVNSCFPNNEYTRSTGTSMAAPGVSGTYGALVHAYKELNNGVTPSSDLVKGTLLNSADDLGNVGPDFKFGWGRINARKAYKVFEEETYQLDSISQGAMNSHLVTIPSGVAQVKIMVYYNDYEGSPMALKALVNDLNMQVIDPTGATLLPYVLDPSPNATTLNLPATNGVDDLNNMEQVVIDSPVAGNYNIEVNGFNIPQGPQKYYVIYEFITSDIIVTYPIGGEGFNPGTTEVIRWDAAEGTQNFQVEYSIDNGLNWMNITSVNSHVRQTNFLVPNIVSGQAIVRVSRNGITGESIAPFSIIGVPENITVVSSCPNGFDLTWDSVPGATQYEVSVLGSKYMDSVITVDTIMASLTGFSAATTQWVSVKAKNAEAIGKRAYAIEKTPGVWNCVLDNDISVELAFPQKGVLPSCSAPTDVAVTVKLSNEGVNPVTNINLNLQLPDGTNQTEVYYGVVLPNEHVYYTFSNTLTNSGSNQNVYFAVWNLDNDQNSLNDSVFSFFREENTLNAGMDYATDFQDQFNCSDATNCGQTICPLIDWVNARNGDDDDIDFRTNSGGTTSSSTGPDAGHTDGSSTDKYLYLEASGSCEYREALLYSPCFDLTNSITPQAKIWYHMYGADMGELHFDVFVNSVWYMDYIPPIMGNNGPQWKESVIDLSAFAGSSNLTLRYRGVTGSDYRSDIALDDFELVELSQGIAGDSAFCQGTSGVVSSVGFGNNATFLWDFGSDASPATAMGSGPHSVSYSNSGQKTISVEVLENGITTTFNSGVTVVNSATPSFDTAQISDNQIYFYNTTPGAISSSWTFGDGGTSSQFNVTHAYATAGMYDISLTSTNVCGVATVNRTIYAGVVGVKDLEVSNHNINIYPNPSDGLVYVDWTQESDFNLIEVVDMKGMVMYSFNVDSSSNLKILDLSTLPKGVYVIRVSSPSERIQNKVIIQ